MRGDLVEHQYIEHEATAMAEFLRDTILKKKKKIRSKRNSFEQALIPTSSEKKYRRQGGMHTALILKARSTGARVLALLAI